MATQQQRTAVLHLRRTFQASRERVFRAWTTPEDMKRWKAPGDRTPPVVEVDLRVGGKYRVHMRSPDGVEMRLVGMYREVDPPKKLVYTWVWETSPEMGQTLVTVEFLERGRMTEVVLDVRDLYEHGWSGSFDKLAEILPTNP
jgi:uncharacterized protein YndB with AHSA1/START domain